MSIAGRLGAVYFTRSQQFHQAPHSGCSFLSSPLTKVYLGLAAMQAFLLHCLSLQALRRGAVKRRKGLVF